MPDPGRMLSHYRLVEKIGQGGMGVVWRAHDEKLDRTVALKVLKPELVGDEEHRQRFLREARSAAAVDHPFIASIFDADEADGTLFIAMEFVEGQTLRALLAKGPLRIPDVQQYATEIAEGLATAHQANLVHRDLKPDNVMVAKNGHAKILDFGLAKVVEKIDEAATLTLGGAEPAAQTTAGAILGTPAYMSPEQARGEPVDSRSDIFSFGSTVYEMITGKAPFQRATYSDTLASILRDEPLSPHDSNPAIPGELSRIISRCLHKKPEDRYNDTRDLVAALKDLKPVHTAQTRPQPLPVRPPKPWARLVAGIAALAAIVALAVVQPWKYLQAPDEPAVASGSSMTDRPNWILVADFEGSPDEPNLAVAARELIVASLEQSDFVLPLTRQLIERGLRSAMKPDSTRVVGEIARDLAIRSSSRAYIEGRVDRVMAGLSVVVRAIDSEFGKPLASVNATAENSEVFISTLSELGRQLRLELGEKRESVTSTRPLREAITPSLAAYQKHLEAERLRRKFGPRASKPLRMEALELDPEFATAWAGLFLDYYNSNQPDSAHLALQNALALPERLTADQMLSLRFAQAFSLRFDLEESLRLTTMAPRTPAWLNNRGVVLGTLGRSEDALQAFTEASEIDPFHPNLAVDSNRYKLLANLGRYDEAYAVALEAFGQPSRLLSLEIPLARCQWDQADSAITAILSDDAAAEGHRKSAELAHVSLQAVRGEIGAARSNLEAMASDEQHRLKRLERDGLLIHFDTVVPSGHAPSALTPHNSTSVLEIVLAGVSAAQRKDLATARRYRHQLKSTPEVEQRRYATDVLILDAWIAAAAGDWHEVIRRLADRGSSGREPQAFGRLHIRWMLGLAFEQLSEFEKAASAYESVLSPLRLKDGFLSPEQLQFGIPYSFAHQRLVLLYSKMGRVEDARRHWEIFEKTFTNPDPELRPMIEEARQALAAAEAKAAL